jgi:hypothetical protein
VTGSPPILSWSLYRSSSHRHASSKITLISSSHLTIRVFLLHLGTLPQPHVSFLSFSCVLDLAIATPQAHYYDLLTVSFNSLSLMRSLFPGNTFTFSSISISSAQVSQIDYVDLEDSRCHVSIVILLELQRVYFVLLSIGSYQDVVADPFNPWDCSVCNLVIILRGVFMVNGKHRTWLTRLSIRT